MYRTLAVALAALFAGQSLAQAATQPPAGGITSACAAVVSGGLADVSNAFLAGSDRLVLAAALRAERTARTCGAEHDAVSFELIAADAYADLNDTKGKCAALRDAARRIVRFSAPGAPARANAVRRAASSCP